MPILSSIIFFIACHGAPADHFSLFAHILKNEGHEVHIYGEKSCIHKFTEKGLFIEKIFDANSLSGTDASLLAQSIAQEASHASYVVTDLGHPFDILLHKAFREECPGVLRYAYYDNPDSYVPGGYSTIADGVMQLADKTLFSNAHLENEKIYKDENSEITLEPHRRLGIGYYPIEEAETLENIRKEHHREFRKRFFAEMYLEDLDQSLFVYYGGNNEEYFEKAFPAFLTFLAEEEKALADIMIIFKQHPGAKIKNRDIDLLEKWMKKYQQQPKAPLILISHWPIYDTHILTEGALYYQTSMAPFLYLAGIPLLQVGHKPNFDLALKTNACYVGFNARELKKNLFNLKKGTQQNHKEKMKQALGYKKEWKRRLLSAFEIID